MCVLMYVDEMFFSGETLDKLCLIWKNGDNRSTSLGIWNVLFSWLFFGIGGARRSLVRCGALKHCFNGRIDPALPGLVSIGKSHDSGHWRVIERKVCERECHRLQAGLALG